MYVEKQFAVSLEVQTKDGAWHRASSILNISQTITIKRFQGQQNTKVIGDFAGVSNTVAIGTVDLTMTAAKAAAIIDAPANNITGPAAPIPNEDYDANGQLIH